MKQKRAYKYRCYPTDEQQQVLARTFGCVRYVYNWALRLRTNAYYQHQQRISYHETSASLTILRPDSNAAFAATYGQEPVSEASSSRSG